MKKKQNKTEEKRKGRIVCLLSFFNRQFGVCHGWLAPTFFYQFFFFWPIFYQKLNYRTMVQAYATAGMVSSNPRFALFGRV